MAYKKVSGRSVYQSLQQKTAEIETESSELSRQVRNNETTIGNLVGEREQCYSKLSLLYLPALEAEQVAKTVHELQGEVQRLFQQKQQRRYELEQYLGASQEKQHTLQEKLQAITSDLEEKNSVIEDIRKNVSDELSGNDHYVDLHSQAQQAQGGFEQNKRRSDAFKSDAQRKLEAYRNEPLFMYLVRNHYGTKEYRANALTANLDAILAEKVNFKEQKQNYDFLLRMPEAIKLQIEQQQQLLGELVKKIKSIEQEVEEKLELPAAMNLKQQAMEERKKVLGAIGNEEKKYQDYTHQQQELNSKKDDYHVKALDRLKGFLKGEGLRDLKARARATPSSEDDNLVAHIEQIDTQIKQLKADTKKAQVKQSELSKTASGLRSISSQYSNRNYDSSRSYFDDGFDIDDFLTGYIAGRLTSQDMHSHIEHHHHFEPEPTYSSSYHHTSSYESSHHDSGSFFDSGGGIGGGGFSSGDGF